MAELGIGVPSTAIPNGPQEKWFDAFSFQASCDTVFGSDTNDIGQFKESVMSNRKLTLIHWMIQINLLLWLAALGSVIAPYPPEYASLPKYIIGGGVIISAFVQHWAYYNLRKWRDDNKGV